MSRQINLFNPVFLAQKKVFNAVAMAQALAVLLIGCVALGAYEQLRNTALAKTAAEGAAQLARRQARLESVNVEFAPRQHSKALDAELAEAQARADALRDVLGVVERNELGSASGYARYFKAVARQTMSGLWLTGLSVGGSGGDIDLQGRAVNATLVPNYLGRLSREPLFQGKAFGAMRIGQPAAGAKDGAAAAPAFVEFEVSTAGAREGASAAVAPAVPRSPEALK